MARWSCALAVVVVVACRDARDDQPAPPAPAPAPRAAAPSGKPTPAPPGPARAGALPPSCQAYRGAIARLGACDDRLSTLDRNQLMNQFLDLERRWAALSPDEVGGLASTCAAALRELGDRAAACPAVVDAVKAAPISDEPAAPAEAAP